MGKILFVLSILAWPFLSSAQSSYITSNTDIILESGSNEQYASPNIYVRGQYEVFTDTWLVTIRLSGATPGTIIREYSVRFTKAEVNANTGAGSGDTEKIQDALEQTVIDYLQPLNASTTFTII